jgi:Holliday junction DNA helicase RuvB
VVLEDFKLDCEMKKELVRMDIPRFTLIAATTRHGDVDHAFRERFGIQESFDLYLVSELCGILQGYARKRGFDARDEQALVEIAQRSRGTPRIALRFMEGIMDYATVHSVEVITWSLIWEYFHDIQKVDQNGLTAVDLRLLKCLVEEGPLSLSSWAAVIGEKAVNVEETYEPFYIREGYIRRTSKGREALEKAHELFSEKRGLRLVA